MGTGHLTVRKWIAAPHFGQGLVGYVRSSWPLGLAGCDLGFAAGWIQRQTGALPCPGPDEHRGRGDHRGGLIGLELAAQRDSRRAGMTRFKAIFIGLNARHGHLASLLCRGGNAVGPAAVLTSRIVRREVVDMTN